MVPDAIPQVFYELLDSVRGFATVLVTRCISWLPGVRLLPRGSVEESFSGIPEAFR
jgi:hypothetical protein